MPSLAAAVGDQVWRAAEPRWQCSVDSFLALPSSRRTTGWGWVQDLRVWMILERFPWKHALHFWLPPKNTTTWNNWVVSRIPMDGKFRPDHREKKGILVGKVSQVLIKINIRVLAYINSWIVGSKIPLLSSWIVAFLTLEPVRKSLQWGTWPRSAPPIQSGVQRPANGGIACESCDQQSGVYLVGLL